MSPPLAATENQKDARTKVRRKKTMTPAALRANQTNGRLSLGPVSDRGKRRSRLNACKHNQRSELPILPGEDEDELSRRLEVWPQILGAETEIERLEAVHAVHMGRRRARSLRSDDADTERRMLAIKKARVDGQAEEARQLGLELDGDLDPAGVVRKLQRSPAGCLLLLNELTCLHNRINKYGILFWSQRERLFHCLGKRLRDLFTDDQIITDWVVALMGAVYGDAPPEEKSQAIGAVFEGMRPSWMDVIEYQVRIDCLVAAVAGREESIERVRSYLDAAIGDLTERLKRARARDRRELKLELESAWVDDTPSGARRLSYRRGHDRAYESSLKRLETLKEERRDEGGSPEDDPDDGIETDETQATEPGPVVETTGEDGTGASGLGVGDSSQAISSSDGDSDGDGDGEGEAPSEPLHSPEITVGSDGASPSRGTGNGTGDTTDTGSAATGDLSSVPGTHDSSTPSGEHEIRNPKFETTPLNPQAPSPVRPPGRDESEPILSAPNVGVGVAASVSVVDVTADSTASSAAGEVNDAVRAAAENRRESNANKPISSLTAVIRPEPPTATPEPVGPVVVEPVEGPGTDVESVPTGADQPVRRWTDLVPLSACRREGSLLPDNTPIPRPRAAAVPGVITPAPVPIHDESLLAVIEKYKNEFADLREFDHLE